MFEDDGLVLADLTSDGVESTAGLDFLDCPDGVAVEVGSHGDLLMS